MPALAACAVRFKTVPAGASTSSARTVDGSGRTDYADIETLPALTALRGTEDPLLKLKNLFAERDPLYREVAHFLLETGRPSVSTLVNMIIMQLELSGHLPARPENHAPQAAS